MAFGVSAAHDTIPPMDEAIEIASNLPGYLATPEGGSRYPGLIIIHEIWGLNDHIKDISRRFSSQGYLVLAPDLMAGTEMEKIVTPELIEELHDPEKKDEAQKKMRAALAPVQNAEFAEDTIRKLEECFKYLKDHQSSTGSVGVIGFCFGGTYSFALAVDQPELKVAIPFYGHGPSYDEIKAISCPILAFYGEQDQALMADLPKLKEDMEKEGKDFQEIVYPNTGHAFFNDTNPQRYNKEAAEDSWIKTLEFLKKHLS